MSSYRIAALVTASALALGWGLAMAKPRAKTPTNSGMKADHMGLTKDSVLTEKTTVPKVHYKGEAPGQNKKLARSYPQAPPMIPHAVADFLPIRRRNTCLECHSNPPRSLRNVTQVPSSHYLTRDKTDLAAVPKGARTIFKGYFYCVTCHAPQTNAKPLVGNTFVPD